MLIGSRSAVGIIIFPHMAYIRLATVATLLVLTLPAHARELVLLDNGDLSGWEAQTFHNVPVTTKYSTVHDIDLGGKAVLAVAISGASGYVLKKELPFDPGTRLLVKWKVNEALNQAEDETSKEGADFPLRVYLYKEDGFLSARILMLVHALKHDRGDTWTSPYSTSSTLIENYAIGGRGTAQGKWVSAKVPVGKIWSQLIGKIPSKLSGAAFMVDSDNSKGRMKTLIGSIVLIND